MIPALFFAVGMAYAGMAWRERDRAPSPLLLLYVAAAGAGVAAAVAGSAVP